MTKTIYSKLFEINETLRNFFKATRSNFIINAKNWAMGFTQPSLFK